MSRELSLYIKRGKVSVRT